MSTNQRRVQNFFIKGRYNLLRGIEKAEIFSVKDIIPSAGQGIISLQCREDNTEIFSILEYIDKQAFSNCIVLAEASHNIYMKK